MPTAASVDRALMALHRLARFCGLHLTDDSQPPAAERRRLMYNVQAMTNQERVERLHLFWSLWSLHCCSILAWQRISAYDDQKDFAIAFNEVGCLFTRAVTG